MKTMTYKVYALFRPDTGRIFYVGAGHGRMPWRHVRERFRPENNRRKNEIICELIDVLGFDEVPIVVLRDGLTMQEAADLEVALIYAIGCEPYGPLVNVRAGGELTSAKTRRLMSTRAKERDRSGEWEARRKARMADPDVRERMAVAKRGEPSAKRGRKFPSARTQAVQSQLGWITNGVEETRISKAALIPSGWRRGRLSTSSMFGRF